MLRATCPAPPSEEIEILVRYKRRGGHVGWEGFAGDLDEDDRVMAAAKRIEAGDAEDNAATLRILEVLGKATKPLKARAIAAAANLSYDSSYFRQAMARLTRSRRITRPDPAVAAYTLTDKKAEERGG
jgi:hypothetical protein